MSVIKKFKKERPKLNYSIVNALGDLDNTKNKKFLPLILKELTRNGNYNDKEVIESFRLWFKNYYFGTDFIKEINIGQSFLSEGYLDGVDFHNISIFDLQRLNQLSLLKKHEKELGKHIYKVYEDENWKVIVPLTAQASVIYGYNSRWCTASKHNISFFYKYAMSGTLVYIFNKQALEKYGVFKEKNSMAISCFDGMDQALDFYHIELPEALFKSVFKLFERNLTVQEIVHNSNLQLSFFEIMGVQMSEEEFNYYSKKEHHDMTLNVKSTITLSSKPRPLYVKGIKPKRLKENYPKHWYYKKLNLKIVRPYGLKSWLRFLWGYDIFIGKIPLFKGILFIFVVILILL